jgi:NADPH2:quinone reductase
MHALEIQTLDGPDGLAYAERADPAAPADDQVLVEVGAAGVSFPDLLMSKGQYQADPELPYVPGQEIAGVVRAAPAGSAFAAGDRVWSYLGTGGGYASVALAPLRNVQRLPDAMSFVDGAALGVNFMTAVFALRVRDDLKAGETLLVLGAAGGLGTATILVGKRYGARVIAVVSTPDKEQTARDCGADEVVVGDDWRDRVLELTDGRGVDVVADIVGGDHTLQAVRTTAPRGRVLILGFTTGSIAKIGVNRLLLRNVSLVGVGLGALDEVDPTTNPTVAELLAGLLGDGRRPVIGDTYALADGADALRALDGRRARGKLVLIPEGQPRP